MPLIAAATPPTLSPANRTGIRPSLIPSLHACAARTSTSGTTKASALAGKGDDEVMPRSCARTRVEMHSLVRSRTDQLRHWRPSFVRRNADSMRPMHAPLVRISVFCPKLEPLPLDAECGTTVSRRLCRSVTDLPYAAVIGPEPMQVPESALLVQQAIQLSVAPVFVLTGIAGLLGVIANRLARIIDRARDIGKRGSSLDSTALALVRLELTSLERRRHLASWSINFCTGAALLVCTVIVTLFIEEFLSANLKWLAGVQFIAAMFAMIAGLSCFLVEVYISTHTSHINALSFEG